MKQETFERFRSFIEQNLGIKMPPAKKILLESRLARRLRFLKIDSYEEYSDYVFSEEGFNREIQQLIDVVTTNETSFFRENQHFLYITDHALPALLDLHKNTHINAWSVASSTGQEAYSLAMVLENYGRTKQLFSYSIFGTDISETVLKVARAGVYTENQAEKISLDFKKKYCLKSKDKDQTTIRIKPELREKILFKRLNLIETPYSIRKKYHLIFCRNVFIYFQKDTQEKILTELCRHLAPGGYLFMGHSENISGIKTSLKSVSNAIYQIKER